MTKDEFYSFLSVSGTEEIRIVTVTGEILYGVVDTIHDTCVVIDETCAFGDMRAIYYSDIQSVCPVLQRDERETEEGETER